MCGRVCFTSVIRLCRKNSTQTTKIQRNIVSNTFTLTRQFDARTGPAHKNPGPAISVVGYSCLWTRPVRVDDDNSELGEERLFARPFPRARANTTSCNDEARTAESISDRIYPSCTDTMPTLQTIYMYDESFTKSNRGPASRSRPRRFKIAISRVYNIRSRDALAMAALGYHFEVAHTVDLLF